MKTPVTHVNVRSLAILNGGPAESPCGAYASEEGVRFADDADQITCKRCRGAFAKSLPAVGQFDTHSIWRELVTKELNVVVMVDREVAGARRSLVQQGEDTIRTLRSAIDDVERAVAQIKVMGAESIHYGPLDRAMEIGRVIGFVAGNVRVDMLAKYGAELERAMRAAVESVKEAK
jgi:hypothetical protein